MNERRETRVERRQSAIPNRGRFLWAVLLLPGLVQPAPAYDAFPDPGSGRPPLRVVSLAVRLERSAGPVRVAATVRWRNGPAPAAAAWILLPLPPGARLAPDALRFAGRPLPFDYVRPSEASREALRLGAGLRRPEALRAAAGPFLRAALPPFAAHAEPAVDLRFEIPPPEDAARIELRIPLLRPGADVDPEGRISLEGSFADPVRPVRLLFSDTHRLDAERDASGALRFARSGRLDAAPPELRIDAVFTLDPVAFRLAAFRDGPGPGACAYALAGAAHSSRLPPFARDVVVAVDASTSMSGERFAAARNAVRALLDGLDPDDRFALVAFETRVAVGPDGMGPATPARREAALAWLAGRKAIGGCALAEALDRSLDLLDAPGRYPLIVLLLDGLPTVGLTKLDEITDHLAGRRAGRAAGGAAVAPRLAAFALGSGVNPRFTDRLVGTFQGWRFYPPDAQALERAARDFARATRRPLLAEISARWSGGDADGAPGAVPEPLRAGPPDLFEDRLLDFVGAYDRPGGQFLTLTGRGPDPGDPGRVLPRSFAFGVRLPDVDASHPEIPRLLAARVLARDWDRARLGAAPFADPVGMEILRRSAGLRFPWLPSDLEDAPPAEGTRRLADAAEAVAARAARGGLPEMKGAGDLPAAESRLLWSLLHDPLSSEAVEDLLGRREGGPAAVAAGGKLFLRRGSGWTDSGVERREGPERTALPPPARTWAAASEAFWNGAAETPALAPFLALGPDVLFEWNGLLFRVTPP